MGPSYSLCAWCINPDAEEWDESLCRAHEAEYDRLSEAELDRRDSEQAAEYIDGIRAAWVIDDSRD